MKKIFAFAMAIVSMAAVMTSCNNDEADFIEQPAPVVTTTNTIENNNNENREGYLDIYLPTTDVQLEMMDMTISYTIGGKTTTITPADMAEIKFNIVDSTDNLAAEGTAKMLKYRVKGYTMDQLKGAAVERTASWNAEGLAKYAGQKVNMYYMLHAQCVYADQAEVAPTFLSNGLMGESSVDDPNFEECVMDVMAAYGAKPRVY